MATAGATSMHPHFADLINPLVPRSRRHELPDVLGIALCAVVWGAES
jgi:hypothetical protein